MMKATSKSLWLVLLSLALSACNGGGSSSKTTVVTPSNTRPVAHAGSDITVIEKQLTTLNGTLSYDEDGDTIFYEWRQTSGPAVALSSESDDTPSFIAPEGEKTLNYQLVTNDGIDISIADTVTVTVIQESTPVPNPNPSTNNAPLADAGNDRTVSTEHLITLDGTQSSDPENDDLTYLWTQVSGTNVTLNFNTIAAPSLTTPDTNGELIFELVVNDGQLNSPPSTVSISVDSSVQNQVPVAHAGNDQTVNGNDTITLDGSQSQDLDGDTLSYLWQQTNGEVVTLSNELTSQPSFIAPESGGTFTFELTVNDGKIDSSIDDVNIEVTAIDPLLIANAGEDQTVSKNVSVTLSGVDSIEPNGLNLDYFWKQTGGPSVILSSTSAINPSFTSPSIDNTTSELILNFSLVVSNGVNNSSADTVMVTVNNTNTAPTANAGENQTVNVNANVTLNGNDSHDPENDQLSYLWQQTSGPTVELSAPTESAPSFVAPENGATLNFTLIVNDGELDSATDFIAITVEEVNHPPVANAGVDRFVGSLSVVALKGINSYDPDGDDISYQWTQVSGPNAILSNTTIANPVFPADTDGHLVFSLIVSDGELVSTEDLINVTVGPIPVTNTKVNGTGITWGANYPTGNNVDCTGEAIEQQDCSLGREQTHNDDSDGRAGFSYTKINNDGTVIDSTEIEWDCVQDNVTGLMWEVKNGGNDIIGDEGITDADDRFSWYNNDASSNGGDVGFEDSGGDICLGYDEEDSSTFCNTQNFTTRINNHALCGYADWRMPTRKELLTLIDYGQNKPMIDSDYFPSSGEFVWSGTPLALESSSAWGVYFDYGNSFSIDRRNTRQVRLVRAGY